MLGDEDLALTALLDAPDLAARTLALRAATDPARAYTDHEPADVRPVSYTPSCHAALERSLAKRVVNP
jgi:hypothetical protein